jgi:hypothetical protein
MMRAGGFALSFATAALVTLLLEPPADWRGDRLDRALPASAGACSTEVTHEASITSAVMVCRAPAAERMIA